MTSLSFTVMPGGVAQLHDLLSCLAKFDENISLEASPENFRISSLNTAKTTHASFTLEPATFFTKYKYTGALGRNPIRGSDTGPWTCQVQNRALASIFKKRNTDGREKDTALEYCEVNLEAKPDQTECRIVIKMFCRHGVVKTYRLTYESFGALHANFDKKTSENYWAISSRTLHDVVEYFGPKTDQLDWFSHAGKFTFTSYTEKVQNGREILKQPMHTSVALERKDFDDFNVQEGLHIGIIVKDFRAIIAHAETLDAPITTRYSRGNKPMQITYEMDGIAACFTLMTRGISSSVPSDSTRNTPARDLSAVSRVPEPAPALSIPVTTQSMPPPNARSFNREATQSIITKPSNRNSPPAPSASLNPESLFIPADDDQQWDEPDYSEQPDFVTWDNASELPSASNSTRRIRDSEPTSFRSIPDTNLAEVQGIAPTQRLSQVRGLFD